MPEGKPTTKPLDEDAAHFLVRMVRKYPHEVTIYAGGPMTNLALAISIDPEFPQLAKELVFMGASLNPQTTDPEFINTPRHEFNIWFDPEAAHIVLRAPWKKMSAPPVDISVKTRMTNELINRIKAGNSPAAQYIGKYARLFGEYNYLWDELAAAAWLDPSLITKKETRFMDVDLGRGAGYGNILTWTDQDKPKIDVQPVEIQVDLDTEKFYKMFVDLLTCAHAEAIAAGNGGRASRPAGRARRPSSIMHSYCVNCSSAFCACTCPGCCLSKSSSTLRALSGVPSSAYTRARFM